MPRPVPTANASLLDFVGSKVADQLQQTSDVVAERRRQKQRGTAATATAGLGTGSGPSEALFASRVDRGRLLAAPRRVPGSCPDASAAAARARAARRAPRPAGELLDAAGVGRTDAVKRHGQNKTKEAVPAAPEEDIGETKQQLIRAFEAYSCLSSEGDSEGQSALSSLEEWVVRSRTCCICIEVIRRQDSIWSCVQCAVQTHLGCVQSWASRFIKFAESQNLKDAEPWGCPNCRHSFRRSDYPSEYLCYCGKERDPRRFGPCGRQHNSTAASERPINKVSTGCFAPAPMSHIWILGERLPGSSGHHVLTAQTAEKNKGERQSTKSWLQHVTAQTSWHGG